MNNLKAFFEIDRSKDLMNELDFPISAKEVTEATKKLKQGKSSGSDSILNEMLKYGNFVLQRVWLNYLTLSCHQVFTLRNGSRESYFLFTKPVTL